MDQKSYAAACTLLVKMDEGGEVDPRRLASYLDEALWHMAEHDDRFRSLYTNYFPESESERPHDYE